MSIEYRKVVAIMNLTDYGLLHERIQRLDVPGVSISPLKGFGDYVNNFSQYGLSDGMKIEIYTTLEQAEEAAELLAQIARDSTEGGGMVAIEPVDLLLNVDKLDSPQSKTPGEEDAD